MSKKSDVTRERIMKTTWRLLEDNPARPVRMSDIAKESGLSRQAVYLHFPARAELLIATARYLDEVLEVDERLKASRTATGVDRLDAWIDAWLGYMPHIYGVARAFMAMYDTDEAARAAWDDRLAAIRHGCAAAVRALDEAGVLDPGLSVERATDSLWMLLSVRNWELLCGGQGWSQDEFVAHMRTMAHRTLVKN